MTSEIPTRGEVWLVGLPRTSGAELQGHRPVVVVNSPAFDEAAARIIVPLTSWRPEFIGRINKLRIPVSDRNGLDEESAADFMHVRSISKGRFVERVGALDAEQVEEIVAGIVIALDYRP